MLTLDAFSLRDLQNIMALLNIAEGDGVTDIRFVRSQISEHIASKAVAERSKTTAEERIRGHAAATMQRRVKAFASPCPTYGCTGFLSVWPGSSAQAGGVVVGCRQCHYSRLEA